MAVMRIEPKDIGELGSIGIFREALKIFGAYVKAYLLIQLVLVLPVGILLLVAEYFIFTQYLPLPPHNINRASPSPGAVSTSGGGLHLDLKGQVEVLLVSSAVSPVLLLALSLSLSATLSTVGLHYTGQPVSFVNAVRGAAPGLWMRQLLTTVHVMGWISLLQPVPSFEYRGSVLWLLVRKIPISILVSVGSFGFGGLLAVSVLGQDYGWAAVKKTLESGGKVKVAILFQLLWIVPGIIEIGLGAAILVQLTKGDLYVDFSPSDLAHLLFTGVVLFAWTTFMCAGVQYVSFKAYHNQSLSDSRYEERAIIVEGYERFGDESKVALPNGAQVKGNVV